MKKYLLVAAVLSMTLCNSAFSASFTIDSAHSQVGFRVKHLVISTVSGRFNKFKGDFNFDSKTGKLENLKVSIDPASIDTNEPDRDKHLRGPDFFDVEKFKSIEFAAKNVEYKDGKPVKVTGDLTMHGVKKSVTLDVNFLGEATDPWGNQKIGFEAKSSIARKDFDIKWNKALDKGGLTVGENVDIVIEGEATMKKEGDKH